MSDLRGPHADILPCNDTIVDIWSSNILGNDRNRVDAPRSSAYYVTELYNRRRMNPTEAVKESREEKPSLMHDLDGVLEEKQ